MGVLVRAALRQAAERWERVYGGVAEILVGLAFIAGEDELALRSRPTARRRAGASGGGGAEPNDRDGDDGGADTAAPVVPGQPDPTDVEM